MALRNAFSKKNALIYALIAISGAALSHYLASKSQQILTQIATYPLLGTLLARKSDAYLADPEWNADYKVRFFSQDPFIAQLEDFITLKEREYLIALAQPLLEPSTVLHANGSRSPHSDRTSSTAFLPYTDPVVTHVALRAAELQGHYPRADVDIQVTSYQQSQKYAAHFDWYDGHLPREHERISTIFAILDSNCTSCGTRFPNVKWPEKGLDERWCSFVECEERDAVQVKAVPGNAVYWKNLDSNMVGDKRTLHAGVPVPEGFKIGLNIWTRVWLNETDSSGDRTETSPTPITRGPLVPI